MVVAVVVEVVVVVVDSVCLVWLDQFVFSGLLVLSR